jgi:hypothetical protein
MPASGRRIVWLRRLLWLAGFACLWLNVHDDPPLCTDAHLLDVTPTTATIGLITRSATGVVAIVRDRDGREVARVASPVARRRHALDVAGLLPDTVYGYEVEVDGAQRHRGRIHTGANDDRTPVRFAFLGDSGDQPWWVWLQRTSAVHWLSDWEWLPVAPAVGQIGAAVAAWQPHFVVHLGDVVYPWGTHAHYRTGYFRAFAEVHRGAPVWAVLGNHDMIGGGAGSRTGGQQLVANLRAPGAAARGDGRQFSFARGPVRIIGLDCNSEYSGERYERGHPAQAFLAAELQRCDEPWIIVASHYPIRSSSRQRDRADLLLSLMPELVANHVSLYLSGHDHCYQRFVDASGVEPPLVVSGGGGKDLYEVRPHDRAVALASAYHWCGGEVVGARLTVQARGLDGAILDEFGLELPTGENLQQIERVRPGRARRIAALR